MKFKKSVVMKYLPILAVLLFFASCGSKKDASKGDPAESSIKIPKKINKVIGIGKVEPKEGIVSLASNTSGIVESVLHYAGDSVRKGEAILVLQKTNVTLKVQQLKDQIATQRQQTEADRATIRQFKVQLKNKKKTLSVSQKLVKTGAETRENVNNQETDKEVLATKLSKAKKEATVSQAKIQELKSQLQMAQNNLSEKTIKAPSDGIILSMDAKAGSAIQALQTFATFAPKEPWVVHGEADEMFANKLKKGQKVNIHYIGNDHIITTGIIISLSSELNNKSLFTDEPGEQQDRRVRRFKVLLDSTDHLLINAKVACDIQID